MLIETQQLGLEPGYEGEGMWNPTPFQVEQMVFSVATADEDRGARRIRPMLPGVSRGTPRPSQVSAHCFGR